MKRAAFLVLVFLGCLLLFLRFGSVVSNRYFDYGGRGGIKITTIPAAQVFLNEKQVGNTPFQDENLSSGEYKIKIATGSSSWQGIVKVNKGTLSVVNRELAEQVASSSGEILTLTSGKGVVVTSSPSGATVEIDGKNYGQTPLSISAFPSGDHTFLLSKDGYLKRSIRAFAPENLTLTIAVDLAITEVDLSAVSAPVVNVSSQAVVKSTPTGFLRVREQPTTASQEITRLNTGDTLTLLDENPTTGWSKIRTADEKEGYVSSTYIEKKSP